MEEKKIKKKKLTLSVSSKIPHNIANYAPNRGKTSVVIEKKSPKRWGDKKFQTRNENFNKPKTSQDLSQKKPLINKSFDIRKIAEERATKRFKNLKEDNLQAKKSSLGKDRGFASKRENKLTISKAFDKVSFCSLFEVKPFSFPKLLFFCCKLTSFKFLNLFVALSSAIFLRSTFLFIDVFFEIKLSLDLGLLKLLSRD